MLSSLGPSQQVHVNCVSMKLYKLYPRLPLPHNYLSQYHTHRYDTGHCQEWSFVGHRQMEVMFGSNVISNFIVSPYWSILGWKNHNSWLLELKWNFIFFDEWKSLHVFDVTLCFCLPTGEGCTCHLLHCALFQLLQNINNRFYVWVKFTIPMDEHVAQS